MLWLFFACQSSSPNSQQSEAPTPQPAIVEPTVVEGMVQIPSGLVLLGPRIVPPIPGYQISQNPMGVTPNNGKGGNNRDEGGPPLPKTENQAAKNKPGVGHIRPGSGVPSAPPNMPGSKAKQVGKEKYLMIMKKKLLKKVFQISIFSMPYAGLALFQE